MRLSLSSDARELTPLEAALAARLRDGFASLSAIPELRLDFETAGGMRVELIAGPGEPAPDAFSIEDSGARVLLHFSGASRTERTLVETTIRAVLDKLEVEKREELLLDELGTNWESLETLYEISTDVLRFGDVRTALKRLIERFTSLQDGLRACLLLGRHGRLEPVVASHVLPPVLDWRDLGPIEKPIRESRSVVINDTPFCPEGGSSMPWRDATSLAAVPVTSRQQTVIGLLLVWRDDRRFEFDAPFCRLLEAITHQASMLLESDRLNRTMLENHRLAKEIEIASSIQQTLLLGNAPTNIPALEMASFSAASQQIDGDFLDFLKHDGSVDVLIGYVMG
ncbi:MAG: GAF domain-containing protein, partial [Acidobacteriota bacterium]